MPDIIIIRPGAIGDTLLTLPALEKLRKHYDNPDHEVHYLYGGRPRIVFVGNAVVLPLMLASGFVDEVHDYDEARWSGLFAPKGIRNAGLREMLRQSYRVICWLRDPDGVVQRNLSDARVSRFTIAPGRPKEGQRIHEASYLAQTIGMRFYDDDRFVLKLNVPAKPSTSRRRPIAVHPGSGSSAKCWPAASFAAVITQLIQRGESVQLLSGPADAECLREVLSLLPTDVKGRSLTVRDSLPLLELASYLLSCSTYLGNDSGITHLAAMLGLYTVALFGPTDPAVWHPIGKYVQVVRSDNLAELSVHSVMEYLH